MRLDAMMEHDRVKVLKQLEETDRRRIEERRKGAAKIRLQIEERRQAAILEQERKDQETKLILKQIADTIEQEKKEKAVKVQAQRKLMQAVNVANEESKELKKKEKILEEEEDRKVLQYLLDKEKREEENERINELKKADREKELARLRAAQEKVFLKNNGRWLISKLSKMLFAQKELLNLMRETGGERKKRLQKSKQTLKEKSEKSVSVNSKLVRKQSPKRVQS